MQQPDAAVQGGAGHAEVACDLGGWLAGIEESDRGADYVPSPERPLVQVGKPGAYEFVAGSVEQHEVAVGHLRSVAETAFDSYRTMLAAGVAREIARGVLPLNLYSSMYVTMNARSLMNFLSLRVHEPESRFPSFPQREIEMVARLMEDEWQRLMPLTHEAFVSNGRVAP